MIDHRRVSSSRFGRATVVVAMLALTGCGGVDGVELNGKVFEAVGLTGALGKKAEPQTEARAPLVLPPSKDQLPEPGSLAAAPAPTPDPAWPNDPDKTRAAQASAQSAAQKQFCRDGNWKEKAMGDEMAAAQGPAGTCTNSIFSVVGPSIFGN
jgi:hypothetical protein